MISGFRTGDSIISGLWATGFGFTTLATRVQGLWAQIRWGVYEDDRG